MHYGLLATGHPMGSIAVGVVALPFSAIAALTRVLDSAYELPPMEDPSLKYEAVTG